MSAQNIPAGLPRLAPEHLTALREALVDAGFSESGLRELWGEAANAALARNDTAPARWALRRSAPPAA